MIILLPEVIGEEVIRWDQRLLLAAYVVTGRSSNVFDNDSQNTRIQAGTSLVRMQDGSLSSLAT